MKISSGKGRTKVTIEARILGNDLLISLYGGTKPHIGAVALSVTRRSLKNRKKKSASTSILTLTGHKDDLIAKSVAEKVSTELGRNVVVAAGVHIEKAKDEEILKIIEESEKCADKIIRRFTSMK
ncbi:MAG: hypothetical protein D6734_03625 [Candidatus Schekmanbacteria bacterium]|nr:MAG: hypothetical protein D6734_03625 [Candidatus Schekmanbacteria bacterium]